MLKANRNDPCPCGSGKKYKNCCMRQDQITASREANLTVAEAALLTALYRYAQGPQFQNDLAQAFEIYWGGRYDLRAISDADVEDMRRTIEWFLHDAHVGEARRHVIDLFIENETREYAPELLEILQAWASSALAVLRVERCSGGRLEALDLLREEPLTIADAIWARNAREGDLLAGRLYTLHGEHRLSRMTLLLPSQHEEPLVAYLRNAYTLYQDEHPKATWDEFLRENGHLVNAFLLSPRAEPLRAYIGPGTPYHDPARFRDRLREATRQAEEAQRRELAERERRREPPRTASGLILPGTVAAPQPQEERAQEEPTPRPRILIPGRDV
ncbi:MAG: SEC-C domain-containing protein [Chloroflexi bacterium]|nr:SEC-C domain-containing protein [Chloroflexota bacterium]